MSAQVDTTINCSVKGASLSDTVDGLAFFMQAFSGLHIDIRLVDGDRLALGALAGSSLDLEDVRYTHDFAEDLQIVQRALKQSFPLPVTHLRSDRWMTRALRLMVEGKRARLPGVTTFPFNFSRAEALKEDGLVAQSIAGKALPLWASTAGKALPLWASTDGRTAITLLGKKLWIPEMSIGAPQVVMTNRTQIAETLAINQR